MTSWVEGEVGMRGDDHEQSFMFSYISAEQRVPQDHPLRTIRAMADKALKHLDKRFAGMYAAWGGRRLRRSGCCARCCCRCCTRCVANGC
jgi:hypothetical protein